MESIEKDKSNRKLQIIEEYTKIYKQYLMTLPLFKVEMEKISGQNRFERSDPTYLKHFNKTVKIGDVCYIDFGHAYTYEAGFQHFGVVVNMCGNKVLVIPMTSNPDTYKKADPTNHYPLPQLFQLKHVKGLNKNSVCFLHDAKFINKARIIDKKAHIDPASSLFKELKERLLLTIQQT